MWKCSNCGTVCSTEVCGRCGFARGERYSEEYISEPYELPAEKIVDKKAAKKAEKAAAKARAKEEKLQKAKQKEKKKSGQNAILGTDIRKPKRLKIVCVVLSVCLILVSAAGAVISLMIHESLLSTSRHLNGVIQDERSQKADLDHRIADLEKEIDDLEGEINDWEGEIDDLENKNRELKEKAEFFDESVKIVVADSGSWYKTYHTYDCDYWRDKAVWMYNKEQVVGNSEYIRCQYCN